jgi:hybrid cluster-associated redox disulfide protein
MNSTDRASITATTTIDDLVTNHPASAQVFIRRRMHCVGCEVDRFHTIADACRIYDQPLTRVLAELRRVAKDK